MKVRLLANAEFLTVNGPLIGDPADVVDATVQVGAGIFRPGLINAHDHLHRNHYPRVGAPPYSNAYAWGEDLHSRFAAELSRAGSLPRQTALLFGALKNLLGGATTVVHHDRWETAFEDDFPIRVARIRNAHSLRLDPNLMSENVGPRSGVLAIHLAEGTDATTADEVREADDLGLLHDQLLAVHLVGTDTDGVSRLRRSGVAVVWCPTSNAFLYGRTAPAALFAPGVDVLIGTDALVSGAGTLLDELAAARALGMICDERLIDAVGATAAKRLGLAAPSLAPGAPADAVLFRRPILEARPRDVALVLVGGNPQMADATLRAIFDLAGVPCEPLTVGGVAKLVAVPLARATREVFALSPECARIVA